MNEEQPLLKDRNLYVIFSITLMAVMGVSSITPAFPKISEELNITKNQVGYLISVFTLPGIVLTPFLGVLADRLGRKAILVPALMLFGILSAFCVFLSVILIYCFYFAFFREWEQHPLVPSTLPSSEIFIQETKEAPPWGITPAC